MFLWDIYLQETKDIFLTPECKRVSSESKHSLSDKETSRKKRFRKEYLRNIKNINKKQYVKLL